MKPTRSADQVSPQAALDVLGGLLEAAQAVAFHESPDTTLQLVADRARALVDARYAALGIVGSDGRLERFFTSGIDEATRARIGALPRGEGLLGLLIRENRSIIVDDIAADPRRAGFPPHHPPMRDFLGVPVPVKGRSVGNLYLTDKRGGGHFTADDQRLVEAFALHAGIAIENARLLAQVNQLAVTTERERISADLHDGLIQDLYGISLHLEDVASRVADPATEALIERSIDSLHLAIADVRNFIYTLEPGLLEGSGLVAGLAALAEETRRNTLLDVAVEAPSRAVPDPPPAVIGDLLAIVSEALSNVARHAHAARAWVKVRDDGRAWHLVVADDGVGMQATGSSLGHQGVRNMTRRAQRIGGSLAFSARPGGGTQVEVVVPHGTAAGGPA
ncbi:MAG TPA: GAF domain-containing protein [Candidatus Sulfotelmatobacter sp.]|nr:GAF domain-containing protein [Candidatus Sulfotelmatobacter sp.]